MKSVFSSLAAAAVLAVSVVAQDTLMINSPGASDLVECRPFLITWSGGVPPYFVTIIPGGGTGGSPLKDFGQQTGTSLTWTVDIPPGTNIDLQITDSTGKSANSAPVTINPNPSGQTDCSSSSAGGGQTTVGQTTGGAPGTTSGGGATTPTSPTTPTGPTSTSGSGGTTKPPTGTTGTSSTTPKSTSTSPSSADGNVARVGLAAIFGGIVAAFLA